MKYRISALFGLVVGVGFAWPAHAQSLEEALITAYANNPTIDAERAKVRSTDEGVSQALSGWRPNIGFTASQGWKSYYSADAIDEYSTLHPQTWALKLSQNIFEGGQTVAGTAKAEDVVKAGRYLLDSAEQTILLNAATAYMDVVREQATLELNIKNEQVLRRQLEASRDRFRVGEITRTDVHQAEARRARAAADRIQAENNLEASRATYQNHVGMVPEKLTRPAPITDLPVSKKDAVDIAIRNYPLVMASTYGAASLEDEVDRLRGILLPSLDFSAGLTQTWESSSEDGHTHAYEAKFTLTVPIYQQGAVYSQLRAARQLAAEARHKIDARRRDAREKAARAWEAVESARAQIESYNAQIRATQVAQKGVEREAAVGSRTVLDVLDAEQEVLDAKVSLVSAQRNEMVAIFELKEAMGDMTAAKMNLRVDLYDPTAHYNEVRDKWFGGRSTGHESGPEVEVE